MQEQGELLRQARELLAKSDAEREELGLKYDELRVKILEIEAKHGDVDQQLALQREQRNA